jgi:hypothetical protein
VLSIDRLAKISLHTLAFNRHPEDIGDALKKHDVALSKLPFQPAIDFKDPVRSAITLEDYVYGAPDTVLDQQFRGTESLFNIEVVRNDRFAGMKRIAGRDAVSAPRVATPTTSGPQPTPAQTRKRFSSRRYFRTLANSALNPSATRRAAWSSNS